MAEGEKTGDKAWWAGLLVLAGAVWMVPHGRLHDFGTVPWFLAGAGLMLGGYFWAVCGPPRVGWWFWGVAVGARLVLLAQAPGDDIFRYVWEGRLLSAGWNPYVHPPEAPELEPLRDGLWSSVQHQTFTAIYPPLAQWLMAGLAWVEASPFFFKVVFAGADLAVAGLLVRRFGRERGLLYAWNPLVIYSFAGGGHYDSVLLLAMVLGWLAWMDGARMRAAGWLGVAMALKWVAVPVLAWVVWRVGLEAWRRKQWSGIWAVAGAGAVPLVLSYVALSGWTGEWTLQLQPAKFSQFARSAELIPGVVGWLWEGSRFQNQWFLVPLAVGWGWVIVRGKDLARSAEALFFVLLVLTPMLHAWYFTWIMPFAVATRNRGAVWVTASGFVYFMLYHHVEAPGGAWELRPWEAGLLWLPYVGGFLWSAWTERGNRR